MTDHLAANLTALAAYQPRTAELLRSAPVDPALALVPMPDGSLTLVRRRPPGLEVLSQPEKARERAAQFAEQKAEMLAGERPLFFAGLRAGYEVREMANRLPRLDYEAARAVYVYEENPVIVRLVLGAHDFTDLAAERRLFFFTGPSAAADCLAHFTGDLKKPLTTQLINLGTPENAQRAMAAVKRTVEAVSEITKNARATVETFYGGLSAGELAGLYAAPEKLRLLLVSNKLSYFVRYSIRDIRMALEKLGARVLVLEEEDLIDRLTGPHQMRILAEFRPHGLLFIDHHRYESEAIHHAGLPFFCFVQDFMQTMIDEKIAVRVTDRDVFLGNMIYLLSAGYPAASLVELPAWTNADLFTAAADRPAATIAADVVFVSNITRHHQAAFNELHSFYAEREPAAARVVELVYERALALYRKDEMYSDWLRFRSLVYDLLAREKAQLASPQAFAVQVYDKIINAMLRHQPLEWAAEAGLDLALYGRGWEEHPSLGRFARGVVENGPALIDLYRGATINLHVNQYHIEHPRILDGLMAGAFFLIRRTGSVGLLDVPECMFDSRDDFLAKVEAYRRDPDKRRELTRRQREKIEQWATYRVCLATTFSHFALQQAGRALAESPRIDADPDAAARLTDLADRYLGDAEGFGLRAGVEMAVTAGVLPASFRERFEKLARYQTKWGSPAWPVLFDRRTKEAITRWVEKTLGERAPAQCSALLAAWRQNEIPEELAYRYLREGVKLPPEKQEAVEACAAAGKQLWPIARQKAPADSIESQRRAEVLFHQKNGRAYQRCIHLTMKNAFRQAFASFTDFLRVTRPGGEMHTVFPSLAEAVGQGARGAAYLAEMAEADPAVFNVGQSLGQTLLGLRVLCEMPGELASDTRARLAEVAEGKTDHWLLAVSLMKERLRAGDRTGARRALDRCGEVPSGVNRLAVEHYRRLLRRSSAVSSAECVTLPDPYLRVARAVATSAHLVLVCHNEARPVICLRLADLTWDKPYARRLAEWLDPDLRLLAAASGRLYLPDSRGGSVRVFGEDLSPAGEMPLPTGRFFCEDFAVTAGGATAAVDPYLGGVWLGGAATINNPQPVRPAGLDPSRPLRLCATAEAFFLAGENRIWRIDSRGAITGPVTTECAFPALTALGDGVALADNWPARLAAFDADLKPRKLAAAVADCPLISLPAVAVGGSDRLFLVDDRAGQVLLFEARAGKNHVKTGR